MFPVAITESCFAMAQISYSKICLASGANALGGGGHGVGRAAPATLPRARLLAGDAGLQSPPSAQSPPLRHDASISSIRLQAGNPKTF